jgi:hypothetical protein
MGRAGAHAFVFDTIGRQDPPAITHPQFFYGFAGVTMAWQFTFLVIAMNPVRFRPMMIPSVLEKLGYVGTVVALHLQERVSPSQLMISAPDALLGVLVRCGRPSANIAALNTTPSPQTSHLRKKVV